jgi:hypothetical protein
VSSDRSQSRTKRRQREGVARVEGEEKEIRAYYWKVVRHMLSTIALTEFLTDNSEDV